MVASEDMKQRIAAQGAEPLSSTSEDYAADIERDQAKWSALIKKLGLRVE
jgi:tripartite-type tricarboxylate transporter receptor subunit TctC